MEPSPSEEKQTKTDYGSLISLVLIIALIVVAAFYVWGERIEKRQTVPIDTEAE